LESSGDEDAERTQTQARAQNAMDDDDDEEEEDAFKDIDEEVEEFVACSVYMAHRIY